MGSLRFAIAIKSVACTDHYNTTLMVADEQRVAVRGRVDIAVMFNDICVMVWEDENLNVDIASFQAQAQLLAELQAKAALFREFSSRGQFKFTGILTSGLQWS
jgi:hypothetical protein